MSFQSLFDKFSGLAFLAEHAIDLAAVLMSIQDSYKIKDFEESRNAALVALGCGSPKIVIPYVEHDRMLLFSMCVIC